MNFLRKAAKFGPDILWRILSVVAIFLLLLFDCFLTWFAHRKNILALLAGEEHHTSVKKLSHGKKESRG